MPNPQRRRSPESPRRRWLARTGAALLALSGFSAGAWAQADFPNKTLKLVVPFAAGGSDVMARAFAETQIAPFAADWDERCHFPVETLRAAFRALRAGGLLVLETVNPRSLIVFAGAPEAPPPTREARALRERYPETGAFARPVPDMRPAPAPAPSARASNPSSQAAMG